MAGHVDRTRLLRPALWMLIVAPIVTLVRALLQVLHIPEPDLYWIGFALGGSLSGLGMLLTGIAVWRAPAFRFLLAGAIIAFTGHYVLQGGIQELYGPSLVQLGTGIVLLPWKKKAVVMGAIAALGAYLRHPLPLMGNLLLAAGAVGLVAAVMDSARSPDMHSEH